MLTEVGLRRLREAYKTQLASVRQDFLRHFSDRELSAMAGFWERVILGASHRYDDTLSMRWLEE